MGEAMGETMSEAMSETMSEKMGEMIKKNTASGDGATFIPFMMLGYPGVEESLRLADAFIEAGAGLLELGVPFSDPIADGPVIQHASAIARKHLPGLRECFGVVAKIRDRHPGTPLVLFTYYNPIFQMGLETFAIEAEKAGVTGVLTVDLPPEEAHEYGEALERQGLKAIFLASPTTQEDRLRDIAHRSTGFVYYISRLGVTGAAAELSESLEGEVGRLRELCDRPIAVGFGISTAEQAAQVSQWADGVVVGSKFLDLIRQVFENKGAFEIALNEVRCLSREIYSALCVKKT